MDEARFRTLVAQGLQAGNDGDSARAVDLFRQAAQVDPGSALPAFLVGSELAAGGRLADAEAAFAQAVLIAPGFHLARYQLGLLQFSAGRPDAALVTWGPLHALPDEAPLGHHVRGFAALARGAYADAVAHWERGLDLAGADAALSADIRLVLAAVRDLASASHPPPALSDAPAPTSPGDRPASRHLH